MTREIKFRAWEPFNGIMNHLDFCLYQDKGEHLEFALPIGKQNMHNSYAVMNLNNLKVMQYTGLKDKNGTEIYEGDFLRWEVFDGMAHFEGVGPVYYDEGAFRLNKHHPVTDYIKNGEVEVVGNIHEHPQLTEVE